MPKPIYLVATDLSSQSRTALSAAVSLARRTGAIVDLFCAVPSLITGEQPILQGNVHESLERLAKRLIADGADVRVTTAVSQDIATAITKHAENTGAAALFVGPSGISGWKKLVLGSVTEQLLRSSPVSVFVARGKTGGHPKSILVGAAMDGESARAVATAIELARATKAKITVLHVVAPTGATFLGAGEGHVAAAWKMELERVSLARRVFADWLKKHTEKDTDVYVQASVVEGHPADTLLREAESRRAELVVVGTHGGGRMREILVGSVARSVATHAKCPVLIVRAPKGRRAPKLAATKSAKPSKG